MQALAFVPSLLKYVTRAAASFRDPRLWIVTLEESGYAFTTTAEREIARDIKDSFGVSRSVLVLVRRFGQWQHCGRGRLECRIVEVFNDSGCLRVMAPACGKSATFSQMGLVKMRTD